MNHSCYQLPDGLLFYVPQRESAADFNCKMLSTSEMLKCDKIAVLELVKGGISATLFCGYHLGFSRQLTSQNDVKSRQM